MTARLPEVPTIASGADVKEQIGYEKFLVVSGILLGCIYVYGHILTFRFQALVVGLWAISIGLFLQLWILLRAGAIARKQLTLIGKLSNFEGDTGPDRLYLLKNDTLFAKIEDWLPLRYQRLRQRGLMSVVPWCNWTAGVVAVILGLFWHNVPAVVVIGGLLIWSGFVQREVFSRYDQTLGQWDKITFVLPEARTLEELARDRMKAQWKTMKRDLPGILIYVCLLLGAFALVWIASRKMQ